MGREGEEGERRLSRFGERKVRKVSRHLGESISLPRTRKRMIPSRRMLFANKSALYSPLVFHKPLLVYAHTRTLRHRFCTIK